MNMADNCNLVYMGLKTNPKNIRSEIISYLVRICDNTIFIVDSWLEGVTIIPYRTNVSEIITAAVNNRDTIHIRPTSKKTVFFAANNKMYNLDENIFADNEEGIKRNMHILFMFEASENNIIFKETKLLTSKRNLHITSRNKKHFHLKPRKKIAEELVTLVLPEYQVECLMMRRYNVRRQLSLQECIGQVLQPDGSAPGGSVNVTTDSANVSNSSPSANLRHNSSLQSVHEDGISYVNPATIERSSFSGSCQSSIEQNTSNSGNATPGSRHPLYECYDMRLSSYATWMEFQQLDTSALAEAGFYNIGVLNQRVIRCFFCGVELVNPASHVNPLQEHIKKSGNCGYLRQKLGEQELEAYKKRLCNESQNSPQTNDNAADRPSASSSNPGHWHASDRIRSPQYAAYSVRLALFDRWPSDVKQRPEQVADAGFYYTGLQDVVRCFACDGGLKNWDPDDEPWVEHARWFPQCPFVKRIKGQEFIDLVRRMAEESDEEEDAVVHSTFQPSNPMADAPTLKNELNLQTDQVEESSMLESVAAKSVIEIGYPRSAVAKAINVLLNKGQSEYTAEDIMTIVMQMEDSGQLREYYEDEDSRSRPRSSNPKTGSVLDLQQENEQLRRSMRCISCRNEDRNILLLPCTHFCLCSTCAKTSNICPLCFKRIGEKIKTYVI
ncbi:hypothetical protein ACJMK2_029372 [Sinanodonta woodiana]|uniref:RING-type domain-containing protein n=1 Tax=Sinanodonta woodiana TaxID=1069815 RepID=A0ABD3X9Z3_SINWO